MNPCRPPLVVATLLQAAFGVTLLVLVRPTAPKAPLQGGGLGLLLGVAVGAGLLVVLARTLPPRLRICRDRLPLVLAKACLLAIGAASEELIWRWVGLGVLVTELGATVAFAATTLGFALSHAGQGWRAVRTHLATGSAFGAVFLATASFAAAAVAHVSYNLGALLASESEVS